MAKQTPNFDPTQLPARVQPTRKQVTPTAPAFPTMPSPDFSGAANVFRAAMEGAADIAEGVDVLRDTERALASARTDAETADLKASAEKVQRSYDLKNAAYMLQMPENLNEIERRVVAEQDKPEEERKGVGQIIDETYADDFAYRQSLKKQMARTRAQEDSNTATLRYQADPNVSTLAEHYANVTEERAETFPDIMMRNTYRATMLENEAKIVDASQKLEFEKAQAEQELHLKQDLHTKMSKNFRGFINPNDSDIPLLLQGATANWVIDAGLESYSQEKWSKPYLKGSDLQQREAQERVLDTAFNVLVDPNLDMSSQKRGQIVASFDLSLLDPDLVATIPQRSLDMEESVLKANNAQVQRGFDNTMEEIDAIAPDDVEDWKNLAHRVKQMLEDPKAPKEGHLGIPSQMAGRVIIGVDEFGNEVTGRLNTGQIRDLRAKYITKAEKMDRAAEIDSMVGKGANEGIGDHKNDQEISNTRFMRKLRPLDDPRGGSGLTLEQAVVSQISELGPEGAATPQIADMITSLPERRGMSILRLIADQPNGQLVLGSKAFQEGLDSQLTAHYYMSIFHRDKGSLMLEAEDLRTGATKLRYDEARKRFNEATQDEKDPLGWKDKWFGEEYWFTDEVGQQIMKQSVISIMARTGMSQEAAVEETRRKWNAAASDPLNENVVRLENVNGTEQHIIPESINTVRNLDPKAPKQIARETFIVGLSGTLTGGYTQIARMATMDAQIHGYGSDTQYAIQQATLSADGKHIVIPMLSEPFAGDVQLMGEYRVPLDPDERQVELMNQKAKIGTLAPVATLQAGGAVGLLFAEKFTNALRVAQERDSDKPLSLHESLEIVDPSIDDVMVLAEFAGRTATDAVSKWWNEGQGIKNTKTGLGILVGVIIDDPEAEEDFVTALRGIIRQPLGTNLEELIAEEKRRTKMTKEEKRKNAEQGRAGAGGPGVGLGRGGGG